LSYSAFGNGEVRILTDHFQAALEKGGIDADLIDMEWLKLKKGIYER
jgi:hypothetical protein